MSYAIGFMLENNRLLVDGERKPMVLAKAASCYEAAVNDAVAAPTQISKGVVAIVRMAMFRRLYMVTRSRSRRSIVQLFIEKVFHHFRSSRNLLLLDGQFKCEKWIPMKKLEDGYDG
ncbi:unnamed protein product [Lactuca virosa]|uniref:Uncharacterized protein n=1 Tax=Lactuca virosa TaxID=75947 RepID=A0AAU9M9P9_9ASTR|nr:unnamed protein product [Lactuca virosa]